MKKKNLLMTAIAIFGLATITFGQTIPSYVPSNGLVGWWPFNGNANDESGNGNNGTVNGAILATDRFGNANSAFGFNGVNCCGTPDPIQEIEITNQILSLVQDYSVSCWMKSTDVSKYQQCLFNSINHTGFAVELNNENIPPNKLMYGVGPANAFWNLIYAPGTYNQFQNNIWYHIIFVKSGTLYSLYQNNQFDGSSMVSASIGYNQSVGIRFGSIGGGNENFKGSLDDFGIWNRALTPQEITALYNAQTCNSTSNTINADGSTTFCAGNSVNLTSDVVGGTYQWKRNGVNIATNSTSRTFKATLTGSYTCVATCSGTVLTSNAISVTSKTNASATVSASGATSFCAGDSVTLNATNLGSNYSVQWYRTNISMENATAYSQVVKQPGTYKVVTKNLTTGCSRISGSAITTNVNCPFANSAYNKFNSTSDNVVNEKITGNDISDGISIYPNPNNGTFVLEYEGEQSGSGFMQVVNSMGQTIYESNVEVSDGLFSKEVKLGDNISKGIYIVRLSINGSSNDSRIIVK